MPVNIEELKKRHGQNATNVPKKPPLVPPHSEPLFVYNQPIEPEDPNVAKKKKELIKKLFDDNEELPMEELLTYILKEQNGKKEGKKVGKTTSPLKGIREGLEDMLNIQQLTQLVKNFSNMKTSPEKGEEDNSMEDNNLLTMLPLLQKMQNGGMDTGKIDPTMLMLAMGMGGQKKSNNMGQLFLMMSMLNMNTQQPQTNSSGQPVQGNPAMNPEMIKAIWTELQNVMQQQQKPAIDPNMMLLFQMMNKSSQQPQNTQNLDIIFDKINSMMANNQTQQMSIMMERSNQQFKEGMREVAGALNREDPRTHLLEDFDLFRNLTGDKRAKNAEEMNYDIKKQEL